MEFVILSVLMLISVIFVWRWQPAVPQTQQSKLGVRFQKLWDDAYEAIKTNKYLKAERALLTILKFDEKNAGAYSRLGVLYAKQKDFTDAIECFEIARSIEPNASSLHNLGLIYYETEEYSKSKEAFEASLKLEDTLASRYIAYAKVQEKLGNDKDVVHSLERAAVLEPSKQTYTMLADAYERNEMQEQAKVIRQKLTKATQAKRKKLVPTIRRQPRRIVM